MPVHHDRDYANQQGAPDIFMNILSDTGYCSRFLTDWAGPDAMVKRARDPPRRAGVPGPHADVHRRGHRRAARRRRRRRRGRVRARSNDLGDHVGGTATLALPSGARVSGRLAGPRRDRRHRPDRVLEGVGPHRAAARVRGGAGRARRRRAGAGRRRRARHVHAGHATRRWRSRATSASGELVAVRAASRTAAARRRGTVMQAAMAVATGVADVVVVLPRVQRALGHALRQHRRHDGATLPPWLVVVRAVRPADTRRVGRAARAPLHARATASPTRTSGASRSSTARTRRPTPTRGSTSGRSRSRTTRRRAGSSSRCCGCSTAARRATAASRSS